ncbi:MAG: hypothetical protein IJV29_06365 [Butyrivibrio sp.]|nr:hypothetical protein [Butyrivibrio sp.]
MLKPNYFNGKSDRVVSLYQSFEDYLIQDIAKFLINAGEIGGKADREIFLLEQLGLSQDDIASRLATLTAQSKEEVRAVLQDSVMTSFSNDKAVLDKYFSGEFSPLDKPSIRAVMDAEWAKTCGELSNLTQTTMEQFNMDVMGLLDQTEVLVSSGGISYNEAVSQILDNYAKVGMTVDYPTGARRSLDSAVRCAVVTSMNQTAGQVTNKYIAEGGIEYVLVSAHTGARYSDKGGLYSHAEWQGKAYKIRGSEEGFPNLLESTGYDIDPETGVGTVVNPHGLHGYNCRHSHQPWDKDLDNPWVNPDGTPKIDPEDSREVYENTQKQRYMERSIRETKRQLVMKQAEIDNLPDDSLAKAEAMASYDKLAYRLRQKNQTYNQFCSEKQLVRQQDRLKTGGFTKADSDKARGRATAWKNDIDSYYGTMPKTWKKIKDTESTQETLKLVNPKCSLPDGNTKNCPNCIVAYVMRKIHGYNVVARPYSEKGSHVLNRKPWLAWEINEDDIMSFSTKDDIMSVLREQPDSMFEIAYKPKNKSGHCVVAEIKDKQVKILDPQKGYECSDNIFKEADSFKIWRIDDKEPSQRGITACMERK